MNKTRNLIDFFESARHSGKGITFIQDLDQEKFLSYDDFFKQAQLFLTHLRRTGVSSGDMLILQVEDNQTFLTLFWACLMGKIIPVPLTLAQTDEYRLKLLKVWDVLGNPYAAFDPGVCDDFETYLIEHGHEKRLAQVQKNRLFPKNFTREIGDLDRETEIECPAPGDTAYIQFSSGSTGDPKGIVLTHHNLLDNIRAFLVAKNAEPDDSYLSWLPLSHDMGLIGWHLNPLVAHADQYLMAPKTFVNNPSVWFDKVSEHKANITCSPNFGFSHLLKFADISPSKTWDLSHVRLIVNGAEHISMTLCNTFLDAMASYGLRRNSLMPGYGLAEATLAVSVTPCTEAFITHYLDVNSLAVGDRAIDVLQTDPACAAYVDEGMLLPGFKARIWDDDGKTLPDGTIGHLQLKSQSVAQGYWNNPAATGEAFTEDGWLRTGDLGFIRNHRLVITGRSKEIIIIGGSNFHPHDIERVAGSARETRGRSVVACGVYDRQDATEELIIFVSYKKALEGFIPVINSIKEQVARDFHLPVSRVLPIESIPRTTSGKLQRVKLGQLYRQGLFDLVASQVNRLLHNRMEKLDIRKIAPGERMSVMTGFICDQAQSILGANRIDPSLSLVSQGFDSLMGIELRNVIECALGMTVPVSWFRKDESLLQFSERLLEMALEGDVTASDPGEACGDKTLPRESSILEQLKDVDRMSEDEIGEMIRALER